ncbi:MAG: CsbD family protein [Anaerolineae bacterium]|nr:CsbD family protein [Anaerolineae bacterium]
MANPTWDKIAGNWKQFTGQVRERWGELTDNEVAQMEGQRDQLAGKIQERYGIAREEANRQIDDWANQLKSD